jgi:23S rRNA pseudouridine2605 synthase
MGADESSSNLVRINKALASAGVCSRRAADELVAAGKVLVNGRPAEPGQKIDPRSDVVELEGRRIDAALPEERKQFYLALNKPTRVVTTAKDPQGRRTVLDFLPKEYSGKRLFPVGRLDFFSEGLLLLTTDGDLANRIMHPGRHLEKEYEVLVRGEVTREKLETMRSGMILAEGEELAPVRVDALKTGPGEYNLDMVLIQGVNRQIRRMCRDMDLTVLRLTRTRQGPVELGGLPPGKVRALSKKEIQELRRAVGL